MTDDIVLPTGEHVYDTIMRRIEPELVLSNLDSLDTPYAGETDTDRSRRYKRYAKAFAQYREQYGVWVQSLKNAAQVYKKAVLRATEKVNGVREDSELESLTHQMLAA